MKIIREITDKAIKYLIILIIIIGYKIVLKVFLFVPIRLLSGKHDNNNGVHDMNMTPKQALAVGWTESEINLYWHDRLHRLQRILSKVKCPVRASRLIDEVREAQKICRSLNQLTVWQLEVVV